MYASQPDAKAQGLPIQFVPERDIAAGIRDGEVRIVSVPERRNRLDLARLVLQGGLSEFLCGAGAPTKIVIKDDPKLDDMLAALIAELLIDGKPIPPGLGVFARYTADTRAGLSLGSLPIEKSLAALYAFIRTGFVPLSHPDKAAGFIEAWSQLAGAILLAGREADVDPYEQDIFPSSMFKNEQRDLLADRAVYLSDRRRAQRWWVQLPAENERGEVQGRLSEQTAIMLSRPNSRVWRFWADYDPDAAGGPIKRMVNRLRGRSVEPGFIFRGVIEHDRKHWAFSTRADKNIPIRSLQPKLQAVESSRSSTAEQDPWVVVQRYDGKMVSGPWSGSVMSDEEVLNIVGPWANSKPIRSRLSWSDLSLILAPFVAVIAVVVGVLSLRATPAAAHDAPPQTAAVQFAAQNYSPARKHGGFEDRPPDFELATPGSGAVIAKLKLPLETKLNPSWPAGRVAVRSRPAGEEFVRTFDPQPMPQGGSLFEFSFPMYLPRKNGQNKIEFWIDYLAATDTDADAPRPYTGKPGVETRRDESFKPRLVILPIAVVGNEGQLGYMPSARRDREKLLALLKGKPICERFSDVVVVPDPAGKPDEPFPTNPTRDNIVDGFEWLKRNTGKSDIAYIAISAHGQCVPAASDQDTPKFYLVPKDCPGGIGPHLKKSALEAKWFVDEIQGLSCQVFVTIDACFSGTGDWSGAVEPHCRYSRARTLIITASRTEAEVTGDGKHGVLMHSLMEAIRESTKTKRDAVTYGSLINTLPAIYKNVVYDKTRKIGFSPRTATDFDELFVIPPLPSPSP